MVFSSIKANNHFVDKRLLYSTYLKYTVLKVKFHDYIANSLYIINLLLLSSHRYWTFYIQHPGSVLCIYHVTQRANGRGRSVCDSAQKIHAALLGSWCCHCWILHLVMGIKRTMIKSKWKQFQNSNNNIN